MTQSTEVATWRGTLDKAMPGIANMLPAHVTQDKFRSVAANTIANNADLRELMQRNPKSVINALVACASDGLMPNGREAAMVTFRGKAGPQLQYIPMIAGVLKRMRQSGEVKSVRSRVVHENDTFHMEYGDDEKLTHRPELEDPGKPIGAYAIIEMADGFVYREYMSAAEIRNVKKAARAKAGPWAGDFEGEMWRKTVLKRAAKYCPFSSDIITLLDRDNAFYDLNHRQENAVPLADQLRAAQKPVQGDEPDEPLDMGDVEYVDEGPLNQPVDVIDEDAEAPAEEVVAEPEDTPREIAEKLFRVLKAAPHTTAFDETLLAAEEDGRLEAIRSDKKLWAGFSKNQVELRQELESKE